MPLETLEEELRHTAAVDKYINIPALRNYFAAAALTGNLAFGIGGQTTKDCAKIAYVCADAMLAEREKKS